MRIGSDELEFRVTGEQSDGRLVAVDVRMPAGGGPPMLHRHDSSELYRVERGELTFYVEDERGQVVRTVTGPGAVLAIPGGREHTIRNESAGPASAFAVFAPGAEMERFARAAAELFKVGTPVEKVVAIAAASGIEITRALEEVAR